MSHERRIIVDFSLDHSGDVVGHSGDVVGRAGQVVALSSSNAHHLINVLRLTDGAELIVVDSVAAREYRGTLQTNTNDRVHSVVLIEELTPRESATAVESVLFALCKGKTNDLVLEKATELGARRLVFWKADRSVVKLDEKRERWQTLAESAAKQSGRSTVPAVHLVPSLTQALSLVSGIGRVFCCSLSKEAVHLSKISPPTESCHVIIGPEGDFSPGEELQIMKAGCELVSLGSLRLRSETAAIAAIASFNAISNVHA